MFALLLYYCSSTSTSTCVCSIYTCICSIYTCICSIYTWVCSIYTWVCSIYTCVCSTYTCVCSTYTCVCSIYTCVCSTCTCVCSTCTCSCTAAFIKSKPAPPKTSREILKPTKQNRRDSVSNICAWCSTFIQPIESFPSRPASPHAHARGSVKTSPACAWSLFRPFTLASMSFSPTAPASLPPTPPRTPPAPSRPPISAPDEP